MRCSPAARSAAACAREQHAVGRQRQIGDGRPRRQHARRARGRSRRSSGSPPVSAHAIDAERGERVGDDGDLLEVEDALARQPGVVGLRHAVLAAQVAAVGHRDAQAAQRPVEAVEDHPGIIASERPVPRRRLIEERVEDFMRISGRFGRVARRPPPHALVHLGRGAHARARHRRQYRHFQRHPRRAAQAAALRRARAAGRRLAHGARHGPAAAEPGAVALPRPTARSRTCSRNRACGTTDAVRGHRRRRARAGQRD